MKLVESELAVGMATAAVAGMALDVVIQAVRDGHVDVRAAGFAVAAVVLGLLAWRHARVVAREASLCEERERRAKDHDQAAEFIAELGVPAALKGKRLTLEERVELAVQTAAKCRDEDWVAALHAELDDDDCASVARHLGLQRIDRGPLQ